MEDCEGQGSSSSLQRIGTSTVAAMAAMAARSGVRMAVHGNTAGHRGACANELHFGRQPLRVRSAAASSAPRTRERSRSVGLDARRSLFSLAFLYLALSALRAILVAL